MVLCLFFFWVEIGLGGSSPRDNDGNGLDGVTSNYNGNSLDDIY